MANYVVRGVPLYPPRQEQQAGRDWLQASDPIAALGSLRDISQWTEEVFGVGLGSGLVDALQWLQSRRDSAPLTAAALASTLRMPDAEAAVLLRQLAGRGLLSLAPGRGEAYLPTPRLDAVLHDMIERLDRSFVPREALHRALLVCELPDAALQVRIERLFDCFFDLGWLYLHNWASLCTMMATLVARVLALEGMRTRVQLGRLVVVRDGCTYNLGGPGTSGAGQFDGHVYCVLGDDEAIIDFGLGVVRRAFRRDTPWAVAVPCRRDGPVLATLEHDRGGHMQWFDDWQSAQGRAELAAAQPIADELMQVYLASRPAGRARIHS